MLWIDGTELALSALAVWALAIEPLLQVSLTHDISTNG